MKLFLLILSAVVAAEAVFNGYGVSRQRSAKKTTKNMGYRKGEEGEGVKEEKKMRKRRRRRR